MNTILAIKNSWDKGKTETLREFANLLLTTYPNCRAIYPIPAKVPAKYDFRLVVEINGKIIGVESQGDPTTDLQKRLIDLVDNFHCEVILCSTRTKGETVWAVEHIESTRNFQTIWTTTYQIKNSSSHYFVNNLKAKHIMELLQRLSII
jgi:hypothetical protein